MRLSISALSIVSCLAMTWGLASVSAEDATGDSTTADDYRSYFEPTSDAEDDDVADSDALLLTPVSSSLAEFGENACNQCGPDACTCAKAAALEKKATSAYKTLFYDNDFSYLCDPCYDNWHLGESLKRMGVGRNWIVDVGGEYRVRYMDEHNLRTKPLSGNSDDFVLQRTRLYVNAEYGDRFRFYAEAIDATSDGQNFRPRGIEVNRFDALNLFGDLKIWENEGQLWARAGRQELLYGAQRLVSPLDWSNTRRTFDGAKMYYRGSNWKVDGWWTRPVPFGQHVTPAGRADRNFDRSDDQAEFVGLWGTYAPEPGKTLDLFFLRLANYSGALTNANLTTGDTDHNLLAARLKGSRCGWLYEAEGGYQFGNWGTDNVSAGFFTLGAGRKFECAPLKPTVWLYYDWASGDSNLNDGTTNTFNQYFPLGHKYLGWMDIIGRQNIQDLNCRVTVPLHEKVKFIAWYHKFWLQSDVDALYNAAGAPIYQDPTGGSGNDVGSELDLIIQWTITPRANIWFGYSHFWVGDYFDSPVIQAAGTPAGGIASNGASGSDADFFYTQFTLRF